MPPCQNRCQTTLRQAPRKLLCTATALWLLALPLSAQAQPRKPKGERVDRVVAIVENEIITEYELQKKAAGHLQGLAGDAAALQRSRQEVLRQALEQEISERLVNHEVQINKDKLGVTDKDIERAIDEVTAANHLDREQLKAALYGQGMTYAEYREKLRQQIERARLMQFKVQGRVRVRDNDVRRLCLERERLGQAQVQVCAGHVLLHLPKNNNAQQREAVWQQARGIRAKLVGGQSLASLAQKYSDDTASEDGLLGCFFRGEMVEPFEKAAFALAEGGVSEVVETSFGLHVIKVFERRQSRGKGCDSEEELQAFRGELFQQEMARQMDVWVHELRQKNFVETKL